MLTYVGLFAGIGGFRLALDSLDLKCVFGAENNSHAVAIYKANFDDDPTCDIAILNPNTMPDFDILCAVGEWDKNDYYLLLATLKTTICKFKLFYMNSWSLFACAIHFARLS